MNANALVLEVEMQFLQKPYAAFVRVTCEQYEFIAKALYKDEEVTQPAREFKLRNLPVVKRGSLLDDKLRKQRPKLHCIDLTKVE